MRNANAQPKEPANRPAERHEERARRRAWLGTQASNGRKTRIGEALGGSQQRQTRASTSPAGFTSGSDNRVGAADNRRIVGVVITYSWRPEGELFPIREGKNYIGAGALSSEPDHRHCDIRIETDPKMSAEHALILCRQGHFDVIDQKSSNGTFLDGELVPLQGTTLPPKAEIRTGATVWTFLRIEPSEIASMTSTDSTKRPDPDGETDDTQPPVR
jgi:hypothetical protein